MRRSRKRRRTVSAYREGDKIVVLIPARFTRAEEAEWVATMVARLEKSEKRRRPSDDELRAPGRRAQRRSYLDGLARAAARCAGSTTRTAAGAVHARATASIRLSTRLQGMPAWVIDYVLVHELAHLLEAGHTPAFWAWVDRYPQGRARQGLPRGCRGRLASSASRPTRRTAPTRAPLRWPDDDA